MTAAQAVMTRAPSAPSPGAKGDVSVRQAGQDSGFEETLDRADAANGEVASDASVAADETVPDRGQSHDAGRKSSSARGHARGEDADALDETAELSADAPAINQITLAQAPGFALALAALSASAFAPQQAQPETQLEGQAPTQSAEPISDEAVLTAILSGSDNEPDTRVKMQGPEMPGQTDPLAETLSLLGLSDDDAADVQASADETAVKVLGRETHLAVSQKAPAAVEAYSALLAETAAAQAAPGPRTSSAETAPADAGEAGKSTTAAVSSAVTGEQAAVTAAAAFSNEGDGSTPGQDRRQDNNGGSSAQQISSATQGGLPTGAQPGAAPAVRGAAVEAPLDSYTDSLSPGSQIARSVTAEIAAADRTGSNTDGVLKVLHLELKPENLGTVTVRMSLKDDVISLHMETSRHETAAAIEKERSALTSALKSSGYVVDEITTQPADGSRFASGRIEAATNDASMSSFAQGDGRSQAQQEFSSPGRGQGGQRNTGGDVSLTPSNSAGDGADEMSRPRTGAIYV